MSDATQRDVPQTPAMSVVVITPDRYDTIRDVMRALAAQSAKQELEIVIVAPSAPLVPADAPEVRDFMAISVLPFAHVARAAAAARAAAIHAARAPIVAFVEDHSFPQPGWARALIEAHRKPYAAVGPAVGNANPGSTIGWANLLIEYAPWMEPACARAVDHLPGHNSSYKRAVLLPYGQELESLLEAESILHWELRSRGLQLWLEPAALTLHMNFTSLAASTRLRLHGGRLFAGARARQWSRARRLAYAAAAPLIPVVRLRRILADTRAARRNSALPHLTYPALLFLLLCDAAGEFMGYVSGAGAEAQRAATFEINADRRPTPTKQCDPAGR